MIREIDINVFCGQLSPTAGRAIVREWDGRARRRRALKFLGGFWALAAISIVIPIAHFVLVPVFFLVGIISAFIIAFQSSQIFGGAAECPACGEIFKVAKNLNRWPVSDVCEHCSANLRLEQPL
ncbi:MAG: hypothetical protein KDD42_03810 [Bdellovibrionales bacterium]|nr:hypothetical protein [Bdellovibrionales bacterium]